MTWIKIEDRLPKDEQEIVFCVYAVDNPCIGWGTSKCGIYSQVNYYPKYDLWGKWDEGNFMLIPGRITHWMPMPNPPEENE